jgi:PAS domain-containing protein
VGEFRALRASIVRLWIDSLSSAEKHDGVLFDQLLRFDEAIDQALAESVDAFAAAKEQRAHLFDTLLSASPDLHFIFDREGRLLYVNQALSCLSDRSPNDMVGKTLFDLGSPVAAEFQAHCERVIASGQRFRGDIAYPLPEGIEATRCRSGCSISTTSKTSTTPMGIRPGMSSCSPWP